MAVYIALLCWSDTVRPWNKQSLYISVVEFCQRDSAGRRWFHHSRSFKVTDQWFWYHSKALCDFLLVNSTNLHTISYYLPVVWQCWSNYRLLQEVSLFN